MLHDPRIAGPDPYWLTHEELGSRSGPNTRVDRFCHQQLGSVYGCSPIYGFAPRMKWTGNEEDTLEAFSDIYRFWWVMYAFVTLLRCLVCSVADRLLMITTSAPTWGRTRTQNT